MAPLKIYEGDELVLAWEKDDDLEPRCSISSCGKAAESNGYCKKHNAEFKDFIDAFKALSNEAKEEVFYQAFNPEGWDLQQFIDA